MHRVTMSNEERAKSYIDVK